MSCCKACLKPIVGKTRHKGYHDQCLIALFGSLEVDPVLPFTSNGFYQQRGTYSQGMSISGAQAKLSAKVDKNRVELTRAEGIIILKPSPPEYPELACNEHLSMNIARLFNIDVPPLALLQFGDMGEHCYAIHRFDRDTKTGKVTCQIEDMMQIMNIHRENDGSKYTSDYVTLGQSVKNATNNKSAPIRNYFNRLVHSFVVGNGDLHLKNISLIKSVTDTSRFYKGLSPHYDVVNSHLYDSNEHTFAIDLLPKDKIPRGLRELGFETGLDLKELGAELEMPKVIITRIIQAAVKLEPQIMGMINRSYLSQDMKVEYAKIVADRLKRLARKSI